jgi:hypothetical protein
MLASRIEQAEKAEPTALMSSLALTSAKKKKREASSSLYRE